MKTDTQVQQNIIRELNWEPSVNATQIGVEVRDGVVTLAGHVDSFAEKWAVERAAQRVSGVKALAVEIHVNLPGSAKRDDADIARTAENVLEWIAYLPKDCVNVQVEHGWITLRGALPWQYQKQAAMDAVHHLMGVTGVSNQIVITPHESMMPHKADVESALKRLTRDPQCVSVDVRGSEVTLTGTIRSWAERDSVRQCAWASPGVSNVVDQMTYGY